MERDLSLQALRGWAALVVLIAHTLLYSAPASVWSLWLNQRAAVAVFFVLSGYVLARSARPLPEFYLRRALRFFPALWAATLLGLTYLYFVHPNVSASPWLMERFPPDRFTPAYVALAFTSLPFILPHAWSICIELLASAAMPVFRWVTGSRAVFWAGLATLVAASFLIDSLIALYAAHFLAGAGLRTVPKAPPALILIVMAATAYLPFGYFDPATSLVELGLAVVLIGNWRWAAGAWLGDRSYGLYLFHFPVMCLLGAVVPGWFLPISTLAITVLLADFSWRGIERPVLALSQRDRRLRWRSAFAEARRQ